MGKSIKRHAKLAPEGRLSAVPGKGTDRRRRLTIAGITALRGSWAFFQAQSSINIDWRTVAWNTISHCGQRESKKMEKQAVTRHKFMNLNRCEGLVSFLADTRLLVEVQISTGTFSRPPSTLQDTDVTKSRLLGRLSIRHPLTRARARQMALLSQSFPLTYSWTQTTRLRSMQPSQASRCL